MQDEYRLKGVSRDRRCGVLLHPTSLPGEDSNGDFGHQAYRFIEFLHANGFRVWQMLPLGPTHEDRSPYQCLSSHAGNPLLISLDWLTDRGWLDTSQISYERGQPEFRIACLQQAAAYFKQNQDTSWNVRLEEFYKKHQHWLDDYALFIALKAAFSGQPWYDWPEAYRLRKPESMALAKQQYAHEIQQVIFEQFVFYTQWHEIRDYARQHKVELFGDMPIFVARDSADVWAGKENFLMDQQGEMQYVAGVPPDAFSETGQRWGNPLYDWEHMARDNFSWWLSRFETQLELFDIIRIDHFRGLQASWHIPAADETAINGEWVDVPGKQLLEALFDRFDSLPLVAEDLGVITDEVIELKDHFKLPGMKVLQFAFDGNNRNPHLPHLHQKGDVVYTGTHDNDTSLGWLTDEALYNKAFYMDYIAQSDASHNELTVSLMRLAMSSVSFLCVIPMQDLLLLDSSARMNIPGTMENNWCWRFDWSQLDKTVLSSLSEFMQLYQR